LKHSRINKLKISKIIVFYFLKIKYYGYKFYKNGCILKCIEIKNNKNA